MVYDNYIWNINCPKAITPHKWFKTSGRSETYLKTRKEVTHVTTSIGGTPGRYNLVMSIANPSLATAN